jgi:CelD/BcsL family acetyltransferase involved in cellulose biosynthesis
VEIKVTEGVVVLDLPEWGALHEIDPYRNVFTTPEWGRVWWEEFGEGKDLMSLTFCDPDPVGLILFMLDETPRGRRLRLLGGDDLTDYMGPLSADPTHLSGIADSLMSFLEGFDRWDYLDAKAMPVPFLFAEWLAESADRHGFDFTISQDEISAVVALPGTFEHYQASLPRKSRHELRRKLRRFDNEVSTSAIATAKADTLDADVKSFVEMHHRSEGNKGRFMKVERATFFARLAHAFGPKGMLSLDFLEADGQRIAAMFSFRFNRTLYVYNSAYLPEFRRLSPGLVLAAKLIERSIEERFRLVDFLRGRERYKFDLGAVALPLHTVQIRRHH